MAAPTDQERRVYIALAALMAVTMLVWIIGTLVINATSDNGPQRPETGICRQTSLNGTPWLICPDGSSYPSIPPDDPSITAP